MKSSAHRRHLPFYIGAVAGLLVLPAAFWLVPELAIVIAANTFFLIYLVLTAIKLPRLTADFLQKNAASEDVPEWAIFAVTLGAAAVAVGSLFVLINKAGEPALLNLGLTLASVALGWMMIHTMAALHYAHRYWQPSASSGDGHAPRGGLDFPGTKRPNGYDFLYFAFVIGMTAQTSDTAIATTAMRKLAVLHGAVSFFFNTVLVAAAVNLAVSLGS